MSIKITLATGFTVIALAAGGTQLLTAKPADMIADPVRGLLLLGFFTVLGRIAFGPVRKR